MSIYCLLFNQNNQLIESHSVFSGWNVRCSLPLWTQKVEVTLPARNSADAQRRKREHQQFKIAFVDHSSRVICMGDVYEVQPNGRVATYIAGGRHRKFGGELVNKQYGLSSTANDVMLEQAATVGEHVVVEGVENNTTAVQGIEYQHVPVDTLMVSLQEFSDAQYRVWDVWLRPPVLSFSSTLGKPELYFKPRVENVLPDWTVERDQIIQTGDSSTTWDYVSDVTVRFGRYSGTQIGGTSTTLTVSGIDLKAVGVKAGDEVKNLTNGEVGKVETFTSTTLTTADNSVSFGAGHEWILSVGDSNETVTSSVTSPLFKKHLYLEQMNLTRSQAQRYANAYTAHFGRIAYDQTLTIGGRTIRHRNGRCYPLYELIRAGRSTIHIANVPHLSTNILANIPQADYITALDYSHDQMTIGITLGNPQQRLDAILKRAGLVNGEAIVPPDTTTIAEIASNSP